MIIIARTLIFITILAFSLSSLGQQNIVIRPILDSNKIRYSLTYLMRKDTTIINRDTLPFYYIAKGKPYVRPKPLPIDTIAPLWTLISLTGEKINLSDLKGKFVLLDFFYMRCHPCVEALPFLQALHMKYKDSGLVVLGIDPYDQLDDGVVQFLTKKGVTYTVLSDLDGEALKKYRISGYPTIFLIDRKGKIIYAPDINDYKKLEDVIIKRL